jgi:ABC-type molybdate transport system ATPase subunit
MTSVLKADLIVYLESGIVKASGTLEYVMNAIPDFQNTIQSLSAELQTKELE